MVNIPNGGVGSYYYRRMTKIWIPAILFIVLYSVLCSPYYIPTNPDILWEFLFCTYRGTTADFTAMWYAFTVMALYFLTPLVIFALKKISAKKGYFIAFVLLFAGLLYRLATYFLHLDYLRYVYYPLYGAADIYIFGLIVGYNNKVKEPRRLYQKCSTLLLALCFFISFLAIYLQQTTHHTWLYDIAYTYMGPTLLSFATVFFLVFHEKEERRHLTNSYIENGINWLGKYSFEFYMIHSWILVKLSPFIQTEHPLNRHLLILFYSFLVSMSLSVMFHLWTENVVKVVDDWLNRKFASTENLYWKKIVSLFTGMFVATYVIYQTFT